MNNRVHYIKPQNNNAQSAIHFGFQKAIAISVANGFSNLKIVIPHLNLLDAPNYFSEGLDILFNNKGEELVKLLKKNRGFPITDFPGKGQTFGCNLLLSNTLKNTYFTDTVFLLLFASYDSFNKVETELFHSTTELVCVLDGESALFNELLSATKGINLSSSIDPNVVAYINSFSAQENTILGRLRSINITEVASHNPTRDRMQSVIDELVVNQITISYKDFLGYLVNDVNFPLNESLELLKWKHNYFGR